MSDSIVVMSNGEVQQIGNPVDIYNEPKNRFVARFIGESNIVTGIMHEDFRVRFAEQEFTCVDRGFEKEEAVDVVIRPEDIKLVSPQDGMLRGTVKSVYFKGVHYEMLIESGETDWLVHSTLMEEKGKEVGLSIYPNDIHIMKKDPSSAL